MTTATIAPAECETALPAGYNVRMPITNILGLDEVADMLGVGRQSIRTYQTRSAQHRKLAEETGNKSFIRPGDLPEPDGRFGNIPYWEKRTITEWMKHRPGRGGHNKDAAKRNAKAVAGKR